ncbi:MAG: YqeG family HAD IIIA-type phosphatase [Allobaculum sp.]
MSYLFPKMTVRSYHELDIQHLKDSGVRLLFVDVDNTITTEAHDGISEDAHQFLLDVAEAGIEPLIFSNNFKFHVNRVLGGYPDVRLRTFVCKPLPFMFWWEMARRKLRPHECAAIGDQLFTDMLGGNLAGATTILTRPLTREERGDTQRMRKLENLVYTRWEKQGLISREDDYVRIL